MHRKKMIETRTAKVKTDTRNDTGNMNVNKGYFYFSKRCFACQKYLFTGRNKTANNNSFAHLGRDAVHKLFLAIKCTPKPPLTNY